MREYFRIDTNEAAMTANRKMKNSWKGLLMLLLSLVFCKYGRDTVLTLFKYMSSMKKYKCHMLFSWDYKVFSDEKTIQDIETKAMVFLSPDEVALQFNKEIKDGFLNGIRQQERANRKKMLIDLPSDPTFEQIAVPPSWKACYVKGDYTPMNIEGGIMLCAKLLDLDKKNSTVTTGNCGAVPHGYMVTPAKFQDTSGLLCSCPWKYLFAYGVEIVEHEAFFSELASKYVQVIDAKIPPSEIKKGDIPIYGYNISASTIEQLCTYFPFMRTEFYNALSTMGGNAWVIFDSKHLGRWG